MISTNIRLVNETKVESSFITMLVTILLEKIAIKYM